MSRVAIQLCFVYTLSHTKEHESGRLKVSTKRSLLVNLSFIMEIEVIDPSQAYGFADLV